MMLYNVLFGQITLAIIFSDWNLINYKFVETVRHFTKTDILWVKLKPYQCARCIIITQRWMTKSTLYKWAIFAIWLLNHDTGIWTHIIHNLAVALTSFTIWLLDQNICTHYRYSQSGCWTKTFAHTIPDILQVQITILHIQNLNLWLWYYETSAQCRHWTKTLSCIHHSQSGSWTKHSHVHLRLLGSNTKPYHLSHTRAPTHLKWWNSKVFQG